MERRLHEMFSCSCGAKFRSMSAEAKHRHNFPALCRRSRSASKSASSADPAPRSVVEDARGRELAPRRPAARTARPRGARLTSEGVVVTFPNALYPVVRWAVERKRDDMRVFGVSTDVQRTVDGQLTALLDLLPTVDEISVALRASVEVA